MIPICWRDGGRKDANSLYPKGLSSTDGLDGRDVARVALRVGHSAQWLCSELQWGSVMSARAVILLSARIHAWHCAELTLAQSSLFGDLSWVLKKLEQKLCLKSNVSFDAIGLFVARKEWKRLRDWLSMRGLDLPFRSC
jgi:hypothetical protein